LVRNILGITCSVNARERNTSIHDIEVWLVGEVKRALSIIWNSLGKTHDIGIADCSSLLKLGRCWSCADIYCNSSEENTEKSGQNSHDEDATVIIDNECAETIDENGK
jgi:hypothetical protein